MTTPPENPRAGHHQARNTQELLDAADQVGARQEQQYSRDPSTTEIPIPAEARAAQAEHQAEQHGAQQHGAEQHQAQPHQAHQPGQQQAAQREPVAERPMAEPAADRATNQAADQATAPAAEQAAVPRHEEKPAERQHHERHGNGNDDEHVALFDPREAEELQGRWREVQTAFVDDPKSAVQGADQLVAQVIQSLTASFAAHKKELDGQWQNSDSSGPETEDLRLALRRYRTLFNQLLNS